MVNHDSRFGIQIRFHDIPHSKPIKKFVQANLEHILLERFGHIPETISVEFTRGPLREKIGCYLEVHEGRHVWKHFDYGKGIQDAFLRCIKPLSAAKEHMIA